MTLVIHKEPYAPRLVTLGQADRILAPDTTTEKPRRELKMAEEKKLDHETGVKKVSQERADKQGPVGTSAEPPAREPNVAVDVKVGNKEGDKDE